MKLFPFQKQGIFYLSFGVTISLLKADPVNLHIVLPLEMTAALVERLLSGK